MKRHTKKRQKKEIVELIQDGAVSAVIDISTRTGREIRERTVHEFGYQEHYVGRA